VPLFKDKIEQGWVNSCALIKVRSFCCTRGTHRSLVQFCLWTVTRCVTLVQQKLLTFIRAHEFTQPCSILSLNSDTIGAPSAAEASYLYHRPWVHSSLFNLVFEQWLIKVRSFCCTRGTHRVTVQRQDWTRLSELMSCDKGKNTMCAPSAAETSDLYHSIWVHSALFNLVFEQVHDGCP
jgi:hypothetical protein